MVERIERIFPALCGTNFQVTSPREKRYNCIAYAECDWCCRVG